MSESSYSSPTTKPLYKGTQIVWYALGILEFLLAFRFVLKLLGANPVAGFVSFVYAMTQLFVAPFIGIFPRVQAQGMVFDWAALLAMLVYLFVAWAIVKLFLISKTVSTPEAAEHLKKQEDK
ncbi:MAG: hypothetical protein A3C50_01595 [Candidatus Staskawiczbacteria bacterium RIFCSPHIGHO2_02_FULL_43_16]|uniref:YggT family protein n=1 Tax=Candidatus Staskawiczbacteria bacterium RIFCSPHIGHO2_01_FULL_41_41 TaxID=1802203 RepID=A0A1G2HUL9_9BACT|nr:MAG: hypothetical protein A2822_04010 [Candidatus Staskawiczbacteria bacterium RIFCSPHIGHO2_01_FULL_41_41]OGZ69074.1 MAG: hypothetical protein A3C50_01595 [Candidatus Staskawiczbacteria bacterium RIFCSPHIGHO2_02_FULL_43_16]OGZ74499.1 MAG: hypothetical protein A3A12_01895 [Candidatus Staskawiczbacteria bacterium RIFCSPLOWO2_01_FULL_43_17b]